MFLAWLWACTGESSGPCAPGPDPTLEIGLGLGEYTPIPDGGEFPLIHGPQGGYHLEIGLRATFVDGSDLVSGELVGTIDGVEHARATPWVDLRCDDAGEALTSWGTLLIYDQTPDFLDGKTTVITARLTDLEGTTVEATSTFVIRDAP